MEQVEYNKAYLIASRVHKGQVRTGTNEPYISHPLAVSQILLEYSRPKEEVIGGILHDTVEDINGAKAKADLIEEIQAGFGIDILKLILGVTKISRHEDGNRQTRVAIDITHFAIQPAGSHNIKIADVMHNLSDLSALDQNFAKQYIREKDLLITEFEKSRKADPEMLYDVRVLINTLMNEFK